jgi:hypothetical protein
MFLNASDFICDKNTSTHSLIGRAIGINFSFSIVEIDGQQQFHHLDPNRPTIAESFRSAHQCHWLQDCFTSLWPPEGLPERHGGWNGVDGSMEWRRWKHGMASIDR